MRGHPYRAYALRRLAVPRSLILLGLLAVTYGRGAELPIVLGGSSKAWKAIEVQMPAAPRVMCETVFRRVSSKERFAVLRSSRPEDEEDSLDDFTRELREAFAASASRSALERASTQMGFEGRELQFKLTSSEGTFDCELFAFTHERRGWAVLHMRPEGEAASKSSPFALFKKRITPPPGVSMLEPLNVVDDAISDYPIGFKIAVRAGTDQVGQILVTDVPDDSQSSRAGIKVGDEIVAINGRQSTSFSADSGRTGELGRIFLNRWPGDKVFLELRSAETHATYSVVLYVQHFYRPWER